MTTQKIYSAISLLSLSLALTACGPSDQTSTTPMVQITAPSAGTTPTPNSSNGYAVSNNIKLTQALNSFHGNMPLPGKFQVITAATAIDINKDGFKDIVIHAFEKVIGSRVSTNLGDVPTANKISILINKRGSYFQEETSTYISGNQSLSGASRKVEMTDINGDGTEDLIFACNREDGRSGQEHDHNTAFMNVMVSTPNGYQIKEFGAKDWYHSAGYAVFNQKTYVAGSGWLFGSPGKSMLQGGFEYKNGALVEAIKFPFQLSPSNFLFFESPGSKNTDYLIQTAAAPNWLGVEGWQYVGGTWTKVGQFDNPGTFVKDVTVKTYNGVVQSAEIYKLGADYIITGMGNSISESAKIDINNNGQYAVVMKLEAAVVTNFTSGTNYVDQLKDVTHGDKLVFYTIKDGKLLNLNININSRPGVNANMLNVVDYNNDGYDDIVLSGFSKTALPDVYLNDRAGSFIFTELVVDYKLNYDIDGFSIIDDFNNDGIMDMVSMPGNGQYENNSTIMSLFAYFTGSR
jgi:hypothetical protein